MRKFLSFFVYFFLLTFSFLYSTDDLKNEVLFHLKENKTKIENLKFKFIQDMETDIEDEKYQKITGEIYFKAPYKFKISFNSDKFLYIFNGKKLFFYDKLKNQILEKDNNNDNFLGIEVINFFFLDDNFLQNFDIVSFWKSDDEKYNFSFLDKRSNDKIFLTINKYFFPEKIVWDKEFSKIFIFISSLQYNVKNIFDTDFEIEKHIKNKKSIEFLKI